MSHSETKAQGGFEPSLLRQTLRTIAVLVGVCVLFVGALSVVAVIVTSRAISAGAPEAARDTAETVKKPLSI